MIYWFEYKIIDKILGYFYLMYILYICVINVFIFMLNFKLIFFVYIYVFWEVFKIKREYNGKKIFLGYKEFYFFVYRRMWRKY